MAPIPSKSVVSVSSEDPLNPASNLLDSNCSPGKKWLCFRENKERRSEVIIELAKRSKITAIEICNFGSAFVEVFVNNSDCPLDDFVTLLPSSMLMSIPDSRAGRSKANTARYGKERLSLAAMSRKWNLVKVICCQKYNGTEQFGLQRISFFNDVYTPKTPDSNSSVNLTSPTSSSHIPYHSPVQPGSRNSSLQQVRSSSERTPKRPRREHGLNEASGPGEDYEFAGIELQSRLFKNCMRGKPSTAASSDFTDEPNWILNRIMSDKSKYADNMTAPSGCSYQRTKLLRKELPKAKGLTDFTETYKCEETKSSPSIGGAFNRMAAYDDELEIGEEPGRNWRRNNHRGTKRGVGKVARSPSASSWLNKRRKMEDLISDLQTLRKGATDSTASIKDLEVKKTFGDKTDSDLTDNCRLNDSRVESSVVGNPGYVECPLCSVLQPAYAIELHASTCGEEPLVSSIFNTVCID